MNCDSRRLLHMSQGQLDELFRNRAAGEIPDGRFDGAFIIAPDTFLTAGAAELIRLLAWRGKVFDARNARVTNLVLPFGLEAVSARVYKAVSRFDGDECIVLDYADTSIIAHWVRDEIRAIAPDVYLGKTYFAGMRMADFVLERGA